MGGRGSSSGGGSSGGGSDTTQDTNQTQISTNTSEPANYTELKGKEEKEFTEKTSEQYKETLNEKEIEAIQEYQGAAYADINKGLRTDGNLSKDDKETIKNLDNALENNKLDRDTVLYRGLKQNEVDKLMNTKEGQTITDKGYQSTSTAKNVASSFARNDYQNGPKSVIAKYNVPKGTNAIHVPSMNRSTGTKSIKDKEKEVLLGRNTKTVFKGFNTRGRNVIAEFDVTN